MHMKVLLTVLLIVAGLVASNARAEQQPRQTEARTCSGHPLIPMSGQFGMI